MRTIKLMTKALFAKFGEELQAVELPHTWNNLDGQDGGGDYWRGIGTYLIELPKPTPGKKQYIEIQGANHVATVYCNDRELGTHKGGFSTFRYDLTPAMKDEDNVLKVVVTNAVSDIYPQTADFTFYGGLYRDVNFIEVEEAHFDLLKDGTAGVFVTPYCAGKTRLDLFPVNADDAIVMVELRDAEGKVVGTGAGGVCEHVAISIDVENPHLWNGMADPYCYTAVAKIVKGEEVVDEVEITYGYRSFRVDANSGFWLNGKNVPLHGVARHQDKLDKGWALSKEDHKEDIEILKELGANTIRLAHYQHDQYFYDLCDHTGFALWTEIPLITKFISSEDAYENTLSQMKELVAQNYNHPSVFFWAIANEILAIGSDNEQLRKNLRDLNKLAKSMDPSRLTAIAEVTYTPMNSEHVYITDIISYNHYFGWYSGDVSEHGVWLDEFHAKNPEIPLGVSEYGADHIEKWHSATPINHDYTEEYGCYFHHEMLKTFAARPYLWSTHVWNGFDFAADARNEGGVLGRNCKGLVSYDRKLKKDSYYIYKAYWNPEPMVHVAGRRFADRAPEERNVTVYTNCDEVTLVVNNIEIETKSVVDHAVVFENVPLNDGANTVTAKAGEIEDSIILNGVSEHNMDYSLPDLVAALAAGNWFDAIADDEDSEEIEVIDGYYSVEDTLGELYENEETLKVIKGWLTSHGNLILNAGLSAIVNMQSYMKFPEVVYRIGSTNPKDIAQLNRQLNKIKKS